MIMKSDLEKEHRENIKVHNVSNGQQKYKDLF